MVAMVITAQPEVRQLYGGAMSILLPSYYIDTSVFRQIPDNQEVFSHADTDRSIIVELLEQQHTSNGVLPAEFYLNNLAEESEAIQASTHQIHELPSSDFPHLTSEDPRLSISVAFGTHVVTKFHDAVEHASRVDVHLACIRLPRVTTDLLIVFNDPIALHPEGSSARSGSVVAEAPRGESRNVVFRDSLNSFRIHDWSLME